MIVIDMDMPQSCRDCYMMCADIKRNNTERPQNCPIKCDIEDIKRDIEQTVDEEADDKKWSRGLNYALCIIDKHLTSTNV